MTRPLALQQLGDVRMLRIRRTYFSRTGSIYWFSWPHGLREIDLGTMARRLGARLANLVRAWPFRVARQSSEMDVWDEHGLKGTGF